MVKTTIEVDEDLWRRFSLIVLRERGERRKNDVIVELLKDYVEQRAYLSTSSSSSGSSEPRRSGGLFSKSETSSCATRFTTGKMSLFSGERS